MLSPALDMLEIPKAALDPGHDPLQRHLADVEQQTADVLDIVYSSAGMTTST